MRRIVRSFYLWAALGTIVLLVLQVAFNELTPLNEKEISELTKIQEKDMEVFLSMDQLLISLATLTIGGVTAVIFQRYKNRKIPSLQLRRAILSWAFSGFSLVCGYLSYEKVEWMLGNSFLNLQKGLVRWPGFLQFAAFALSLSFLLNFVLRALEDAPKSTVPAVEDE
jgi:hypothetical protein